MNIYEKYLKSEIRKSKKFKKNNTINIISVKSNTKNFSIDILNKLNNKHNIGYKIILKEYNNIEDIILEKDSIIILPIEGVFLSFLIYNYNKEEKYKYLITKNNEYIFNIGYDISEYYISKINNLEPVFFTEKYKNILKFIYDTVSLKEKYVFGIKNTLEYLSRYYL
ncbi:hypothetical protein MJ1_0730 [Nanobdella aerobiophila]|uniref:Uncharacterized protein n=1 Tax=Nanobdella aerobiophila TaxID=2586965 RepID=A0A915SLC4_9ARCH|nr:hypothetical protein [Nanobdella aerobiophila]BBL45871.1 hypothetical protein MJ1_0730 [Nanobdella aerobiophila]